MGGKALRLWAWARVPHPGKPGQLYEPYLCADCSVYALGDPGDEAKRVARRCRRMGLPPVKGTSQLPRQPRPYMGRARLPIVGPGPVKYQGFKCNPERPPEDFWAGCPASWYHTPFVVSVQRYTRFRTGDGGRVPNPLFDRAPEHVQEAVLYLEDQQERRVDYQAELVREHEEIRRKMQEEQDKRAGRRRPGAS